MDPFVRSIYLGEIETQCRFGLNAVTYLNSAMQALHSNDAQSTEQRMYTHREVFRSIHSFLTHASNISKMLWPALPKRRKNENDEQYGDRCSTLKKVRRAAELRTSLSLPHDEHQLKSRRLRDHLEHFDERLDDWEETSSHRIYVQDTIGPPTAIVGPQETDRMRWFDPYTNNFLFRGETFNLQEIATAIDEILAVAVSISEEERARTP